MSAMLKLPLDLPHVRILKTELLPDEIIITVESTRQSAVCHQCGRETRKFHTYGRTVRLRHLPILGRRVYIELRPKRFECRNCSDRPTTTQQLDWYDPHSPHTKAYEQSLLMSLINSTIADVVRKQGVSEEAVLGALDRHIPSQVDWTEFTSLAVIGLDEIARTKGHRDFVTIVSARPAPNRLAILGVLPGREKETVAAFLRMIPRSLRATMRSACCDMYEGYVNAVKEELPGVQVVIDRFHVAKAYRECADKLRRSETRAIKAELPPEEYAGLKGSLWAFRRAPANLSPEEKEVLDLLFECAPELQIAYHLREELTEIFEADHTKASATCALQAWSAQVRESGLDCFDSFLTTLDNWLDEITNFFLDRLTSGFVEGFNNKLKVLKRRCYGILNLKHFFQRIYLDLEGYRLFGR
jgi:transposase